MVPSAAWGTMEAPESEGDASLEWTPQNPSFHDDTLYSWLQVLLSTQCSALGAMGVPGICVAEAAQAAPL